MDGKSDENIYKSRLEKLNTSDDGPKTTSPTSETLNRGGSASDMSSASSTEPKPPISIFLTPQQIADVLRQIIERFDSK